MTVRLRHLGRVVIGLVVVSFVAGGLSVEAITRAGVSRAQRALPGALARAVVPHEAGEAAATLAAARRHANAGRPADAATSLESLLAEQPTAELEYATALAHMAAGDGETAARHAQLATRLDPDNAHTRAFAARAVDLLLAWRVRPVTRPLTVVGATVLTFLLFGALARRRERKRLALYLDSLSARVHAWADGEALGHPLALGPRTETLTLDVFLSGRYGMAAPRRPERAPTLHMAFSSAGSNQTIRVRPVKGVTDSAVRVPVSKDTLAKLLAQPGRWRLHLRLGTRPILAVPLEVHGATAHASRPSPRAHYARG